MSKSQEDMILDYLKAGKSITPLEALRLFGCLRLGARCFEIKQKGYNVKSEIIRNPETGKHYASYRLEKKNEETLETNSLFPELCCK